MLASIFGFSGRAGRGSWWIAHFFLVPVIFFAAFIVPIGLAYVNPESASVSWIFLIAAIIAAVGLNISNTVKRYHDRGKSGWWYFLVLIPIVGGLWQWIECGFCSGDEGDNEYGSPPGSLHREARLSNEIAGISKAGNAKFDKIDDDYLASYAQKLAAAHTAQQTTTATPAFGVTSTRPTFGKR
jgi:uncharacterized membrane protein YhaH (DUF805 family)